MKISKITSLVVPALILLVGCGGSADNINSNSLSASIVKTSSSEEACTVEINKTCLVNMPIAQFPADKCDGKLQEFTVVWDGQEAITVSGVSNDSNLDPVKRGDEVTFFGPFEQNDVVVTIDGVGHSVFHMSCSDENFNSADDCNKVAGNGKADSDQFINKWSVEGFVDNSGQVLDCTQPLLNTLPTATSCDVSDMPGMDCESLGKPVELSFLYNQSVECNSSANSQGDKTSCTDSGTLGQFVSVNVINNPEDYNFENAECLTDGDIFTVTPTDGSFSSSFEIQVYDDPNCDNQQPKTTNNYSQKTNNSSQNLDIHLSCSAPLAVGDVFGALELTSFNGQDGSVDLLYGYEVKNTGLENLVDLNISDSNESVVFDAPDANDPLFNPTQPFQLNSGETAKFTATAMALIGSSSSAAVLDYSSSECGNSNEVPVIKVEPPCMLSLELYKIEDDKIKYKIFNDGDSDVMLSDLSFAWPGADVDLEKVKFDGNDIIKDVALPSPVTLDSFLKEPNDRVLKAGDNAKIEFEFTNKFPLQDEQALEDFTYTFDFGDGVDCSLSNAAGSVREIVWFDKNSNGIFDEGTTNPQLKEELEGVKVTFTINGVDTVVLTNSLGVATISGLEDGAVVTITVDNPFSDSLLDSTNPTTVIAIENETVTDITGYQEDV